MKWLRETSIQYIPGVEFDGESINFQNNDISWEEDYFTILPLSDGKLMIKAFGTSSSPNDSCSPSSNITVYWRTKGSVDWTSLTFSNPTIGNHAALRGYVTKTVSLTAGIPIELKCSTGLTRRSSEVTLSGTVTVVNPGKIITDCPAIIAGNLESLVIGIVNVNNISVWWSSYLDGLKELFKDWKNLIDASNLIMPYNLARSAQPDYTELFSGCSNLINAPVLNKISANYTECFKNCGSLRSLYADLDPTTYSYILTDWLKETELGSRTLYVPEDLDSNYNLNLPITGISLNGISSSWTRKSFEF